MHELTLFTFDKFLIFNRYIVIHDIVMNFQNIEKIKTISFTKKLSLVKTSTNSSLLYYYS